MNASQRVDADQPVSVVERIAEAARSATLLPSTDWIAMRGEAEELLRGMTEAAEDCDRQALSPTNTVAEARASRNSAEDFRHEGRRLQAAIDQVDAMLPALRAAEHKAAIMPAYEKYRDERAAFIKRLRDRWPKIAAEMLEMVEGIEQYRRQPGVEIPDGEDSLRGDVELEARGLASFMGTYAAGGGYWVPRLTEASIPDFQAAGDGWLWTHMRSSR